MRGATTVAGESKVTTDPEIVTACTPKVVLFGATPELTAHDTIGSPEGTMIDAGVPTT